MREVTIAEDTIRLGQLLELAGAVEAGSEVERLLEAPEVTVDGGVEARRSRQVRRGDVVGVPGDEIRVVWRCQRREHAAPRPAPSQSPTRPW